jgi:hypothetical protein
VAKSDVDGRHKRTMRTHESRPLKYAPANMLSSITDDCLTFSTIPSFEYAGGAGPNATNEVGLRCVGRNVAIRNQAHALVNDSSHKYTKHVHVVHFAILEPVAHTARHQ